MPLTPGDRVGHYEIVGPLGSGGMGTVYRARDPRLERDVALKFLHTSPDEGPNRSRLSREARAASALNHPNICAVYDLGEADGNPYIAMELVKGRPVSDDVPAGGLETAAVISRARQTASALAHAHDCGVVHGDLKSANILCDTSGHLKVVDFGLARRLSAATIEQATRSADSLEKDGVIAGTLGWMAPELLRGSAPDARSDLWALGVLIYELSSGQLPFRGASHFDLAARILNDAPPALPERLPASLQQIAAALLHKDPSERYQSAAEVVDALAAIQRGGPADDPASVMPGEQTAGQRLRRPVPLVLAGLAVIAVAAWLMFDPLADAGLSLSEHQLVSTLARSQSQPAMSADGRTVAFVAPDERDVSQIWVQYLDQDEPRLVTNGDVAASRPRWSANEIIYARRGEGIWTVSPLGGTPRRIIESGFNPNLSADGRWLVYERDQAIWIAGADGSAARQVEHIPEKYYSIPATPAFSPDAQSIVYFRPEAGPNGDFWIAQVNGSDPPRQLTTDFREGGSPFWTSEGQIIFSSARAGSRTLWQVAASGGTPVPLTTGSGEDDEPELSRDGTRLLYSTVKNSWGLMIGDVDGLNDHQLLERRTEMLFPQFSPDGSRIVFFGRNGKAVAIFTLGADGTALTTLTGGTELNHMPRWSGDGRSIYFFQIRPEPSFRRIPAVGGASVATLPLTWETENFPQFEPSGRLSYTKRHPGGDRQTMVRDLSSGAERALPGPPLYGARWSRDGRLLLGVRPGGIVAFCAADGSFCRDLTTGETPAWSGDGSQIYFVRGARGAPGRKAELWSIDSQGQGLRKRRALGPFRVIDTFFDVSPRDEITWGEYRAGQREIWAMQVH